jgi:hypothetical protein
MHRGFIVVSLLLQPTFIEAFGNGIEHYEVSVQTCLNKAFLVSYLKNLSGFCRELLREFNQPLLDVILSDLLHFLKRLRLVLLQNIMRGIYPVDCP